MTDGWTVFDTYEIAKSINTHRSAAEYLKKKNENQKLMKIYANKKNNKSYCNLRKQLIVLRGKDLIFNM